LLPKGGKMPSRIKSLEWVLPVSECDIWHNEEDSRRAERIKKAVREAVGQLTPEQQEFVQLYWFEGESLKRIAGLWGSNRYRMNAFKNRIIKKLKKDLAGFVSREFGIKSTVKQNCPICASENSRHINSLLSGKKPSETYGRYIRLINQRFHLDIKTPQVIIGHLKYHVREEL